MPKHGFLTPKAIGNRIKAKGLSKLRWYCEMCQKQCRDENGFKCHQTSEGHLRQMRIFSENPEAVMKEVGGWVGEWMGRWAMGDDWNVEAGYSRTLSIRFWSSSLQDGSSEQKRQCWLCRDRCTAAVRSSTAVLLCLCPLSRATINSRLVAL